MNKGTREFKDTELEDYDNIWSEWREMVKHGIVLAIEDDIRNLFAMFTVMKSKEELILGDVEANINSQKIKLGVCKSELLRTKYADGSMSSRNSFAEADPKYITQLEKYSIGEDSLAIQKNVVKALETCTNALSREMSSRMKK